MKSYLYHHGILGQRWGVRRFENEDGTLTAAGRKRYEEDSNGNYKPVSNKSTATNNKQVSDKSNTENNKPEKTKNNDIDNKTGDKLNKKDQGYHAVDDLNDRGHSGYNTKAMILFDAKDVVGDITVKELVKSGVDMRGVNDVDDIIKRMWGNAA